MQKKVGVVGLGYIGLPLLAALASVNYNVVGIDVNQRKIRYLQRNYEADIYEPGLNETLKRFKSKIEFTTNYSYLVRECDTIMVTVGTPLGKNNTLNLNHVTVVINEIGKHLRKGQLVVLKSTLLPDMTRQLALRLEEISKLKAGEDFYVAYCPERTIEGATLQELYALPKIVGGINAESADKAASVIGKLGGRIIKVSSSEVAELCKIIDNAYRASNIAFANEIGYICEKIGIDAYEVASASNEAYERNNLFRAGLGAGGPCLSKDPQILAYYAKSVGVDAKILADSIIKNEESTLRVASLLSSFIKGKKIKKPKVSLIGLAFKGFPETDDIRGSPTIKIYDTLREEFKNIEFKFYDPVIKNFLGNPVSQTLEECVKGSNVIAFLTDHRSLMNIEASFILSGSDRPLMVVDCWHNIANPEDIKLDKGVQIFRIGDGRL